MTFRRIDAPPVPAPPSTIRWRRKRLLEAGFTAALAGRLAQDAGTDIHAVLDLVDLAPLERP
jgi:hypothetical protein